MKVLPSCLRLSHLFFFFQTKLLPTVVLCENLASVTASSREKRLRITQLPPIALYRTMTVWQEVIRGGGHFL